VTVGSIFDPIRPPWKLFNCSLCFGYWAGVIISTLSMFGIVSLFGDICKTYGDIVMLGFLSSGASYVLCVIVDDYGIKFKKMVDK
jgi:hypothetical protein